MSLSALEIGAVTQLLARDLKGGVVRKVFSPRDSDRIVLELRTPGENHYLQFVLASTATRLGRIESKPPVCQKPHPFVMLLRREAVGMVVDTITQINRDRAVKIVFARPGAPQASLVAELTSRHGNIFWLDNEDIISGSFRPNRSHKRRLVPGNPYLPPLDRPAGTQVGQKSRFSSRMESLETQVETHYRQLERNQGETRERHAAKRLAAQAHKFLVRLCEKLEKDRMRAEESKRLEELGHLMQANLYRAKRGDSTVLVSDFEGHPRTIHLDPTLDPVGNMQRFFNKAKRLRRATPIIGDRQKVMGDKLEIVTSTLAELEDCPLGRVREIQQELEKLFPRFAGGGQGRAGAPERLPYKEYTIFGGRAARVGRSARDNDELTLRHAKPGDLWLHVRERKGSHVVVPLGRGEEPSAELLVDAAHLAAHFSDARGDQDVEVTYTRRRYVQKPRGAATGAVRVLREKTIALRVEDSRLKRLLG